MHAAPRQRAFFCEGNLSFVSDPVYSIGLIV